MGNATLVIITALCSGLIATLVTILWQRSVERKKEKARIFTVLMSKRYEIPAEESVDALNMIDIVFYKSAKVRAAWKSFLDAANAQDSESKNQMILDRHLKLLEIIAEDIGYKNIHWDDIKQYYYPIGLSNRKNDEEKLRRAQLGAALAQINKNEEQPKTGQIDGETEMNNQMLLKVLENPEGFVKLVEAAEKAQNLGKANK